MNDNEEKKEFKLTYSFSTEEIAILARFMRDYQAQLPKGLENFYKSLEDSIYNCLSLEEVKNFYS